MNHCTVRIVVNSLVTLRNIATALFSSFREEHDVEDGGMSLQLALPRVSIQNSFRCNKSFRYLSPQGRHVARLLYIMHKTLTYVPAAGSELMIYVFKVVSIFLCLKYETFYLCIQQRSINFVKCPARGWLWKMYWWGYWRKWLWHFDSTTLTLIWSN
jgi:hypothetical protein